jgi:polyvinyl alcohol dehydrogenase (cytochrome)
VVQKLYHYLHFRRLDKNFAPAANYPLLLAVVLESHCRTSLVDLSIRARLLTLPTFLAALLFPAVASAQEDAKDWPTYNRDVLGSRHNAAETAINASNAGRLEEKWRFPAKDSGEPIGVIHATPIVVGGYVYFGTATDPTFYKLAPDGTLRWKYRNRDRGGGLAGLAASLTGGKNARFQSSADGIHGSALVTGDTVFFGDIGGWLYALDRATGKERWKLNSRAKQFPGAHAINLFFASPIMADGKLIVAGGTL